MKEIISKQNYFYLTNINYIRPIDMYLMEIINITIDFLSETINKNKKVIKIGIDKKMKKKIAELVLIDAFDFIQSCIKCKHNCLNEKNFDGTRFFEDNFFNKGQIKKENLPDGLKEMKKIDFFIYEISICIANKIIDRIKTTFTYEKAISMPFLALLSVIIISMS